MLSYEVPKEERVMEFHRVVGNNKNPNIGTKGNTTKRSSNFQHRSLDTANLLPNLSGGSWG